MKLPVITSILIMLSVSLANSQNITLLIGPTAAMAGNIDYENGLSEDNPPMSFLAIPAGYKLSINTYTKSSKIQYGIELSNEFIKYGIYLPYLFPGDILANTTTKLKIINNSMKVGIGGGVRYNGDNFIFGITLCYDVSITNNTESYFELGYNGEKDSSWPNKNYSSGKGPSLGIHLEKQLNNFILGLGANYKSYNQKYIDVVFLHEWKITPLVFGFYFGYKI